MERVTIVCRYDFSCIDDDQDILEAIIIYLYSGLIGVIESLIDERVQDDYDYDQAYFRLSNVIYKEIHGVSLLVYPLIKPYMDIGYEIEEAYMLPGSIYDTVITMSIINLNIKDNYEKSNFTDTDIPF
jgi:uncharacterized protein with ParB-like and HNH nuclease domain